MIPVRRITITRAEGPTELCGKPQAFTSFQAANQWLSDNSPTFPAKGGYDKHDFLVEFADGETYDGRLDCKYSSCQDNDLDIKEHMLRFLEWQAGITKYPWCGVEKYHQILERTTTTESRDAAYEFIYRYLVE